MSEKELLDEESIPAGLRTIFTRIQRRDTIDALKEFGVALTDSEGKFVGAYKAIQLLSEGLSSIDPRDLKFSEIVEQLGGFRQIGKVIPLIHEFATAQDALRIAQQGQGSLAKDAMTGISTKEFMELKAIAQSALQEGKGLWK